MIGCIIAQQGGHVNPHVGQKSSYSTGEISIQFANISILLRAERQYLASQPVLAIELPGESNYN